MPIARIADIEAGMKQDDGQNGAREPAFIAFQPSRGEVVAWR